MLLAPLLAVLAASGLPGTACPGEGARRAAAVASLTLTRPAPGSTSFVIEASRSAAGVTLPWAGAEVTITSAGKTFKRQADLLGRVVLGAADVLPEAPTDRFEIAARVTLDGKETARSLVMTPEEMNSYFDSAARDAVDQGTRLAKQGKYEEALCMYRRAMNWNDGSGRAVYNTALVYELSGKHNAALDYYRKYLEAGFGARQDRDDAKRKCVAIVTRKLGYVPPVSRKAIVALAMGNEAVRKDQYQKALTLYELAQVFAPWWKEPYWSAGALYEHMGYQTNRGYFDAAKQQYRAFLEAADPKDDRAEKVRKKIEDMESIEKGLKAPPTILKRVD